MAFSKLGSAKTPKAPSKPIKIFETLPSLAGTPNDLWRGQDRALIEWQKVCDKRDVLISLNTGAGKDKTTAVKSAMPNLLWARFRHCYGICSRLGIRGIRLPGRGTSGCGARDDQVPGARPDGLLPP